MLLHDTFERYWDFYVMVIDYYAKYPDPELKMSRRMWKETMEGGGSQQRKRQMRVQMMGIMNRADKMEDCLIRLYLLYSWLEEQTYMFNSNGYTVYACQKCIHNITSVTEITGKDSDLLSFKSRVSVVYKSDWPSVN